MSGQISYNLNLLEEVRVAAQKAGGQVGNVGDVVSALHVASSAFGTTPGAGALSRAVAEAVTGAAAQCRHGETLLRAVSRSVDGVMSAIEQADRAGTQNFTAGLDHTGATSYFSGGGSGSGGGGADTTAPAGADPAAGTAPPVDPGHGVVVNLPRGMGSVEAPNDKAAGAVRAALSQLGTPYVWDADTPGKGFDCSGLTMWAYGQEGITLQHFAAAQDVGERVAQANLAPGDLVVWDGHVAMYIGKGQMIEAPQPGEVVHIVPLRTTNAGDRFEGFYRPTA